MCMNKLGSARVSFYQSIFEELGQWLEAVTP